MGKHYSYLPAITILAINERKLLPASFGSGSEYSDLENITFNFQKKVQWKGNAFSMSPQSREEQNLSVQFFMLWL